MVNFVLYACCIPVKGKKESLIMDLQRESYFPIPNLLCDILLTNINQSVSLQELKEVYNNQFDEGIDCFFEMLHDEEYGFYTSLPELFPQLDTNYISPFQIYSAIFNVDERFNYDVLHTIDQACTLGCQQLKLRFFGDPEFSRLKEIVRRIKHTRLKVLEFLLDWNFSSLDKLEELAALEPRLYIVVYSAEGKCLKHKEIENITLIDQKINLLPKERYSPDRMTVNVQFYCESLNYNVGLNGKLCVDHRGNILNFLSHKAKFGNVNEDKLENVLKDIEFRKLWSITNDKIEKCRICQFRYMCTSNSDIEFKNGKYYKTDDCGYDPEINQWKV